MLFVIWHKQLPYFCATKSQYCLQYLRSSFSLIPTLPLFPSSPWSFLFSSLFVISTRVPDICVVFWARKKVVSLILTGDTGKFHCSRWAGNSKVRFRGTNKMAWLNSEPSTAEKWDAHTHTLHYIFVQEHFCWRRNCCLLLFGGYPLGIMILWHCPQYIVHNKVPCCLTCHWICPC